jgi:hypothetical protein
MSAAPDSENVHAGGCAGKSGPAWACAASGRYQGRRASRQGRRSRGIGRGGAEALREPRETLRDVRDAEGERPELVVELARGGRRWRWERGAVELERRVPQVKCTAQRKSVASGASSVSSASTSEAVSSVSESTADRRPRADTGEKARAEPSDTARFHPGNTACARPGGGPRLSRRHGPHWRGRLRARRWVLLRGRLQQWSAQRRRVRLRLRQRRGRTERELPSERGRGRRRVRVSVERRARRGRRLGLGGLVRWLGCAPRAVVELGARCGPRAEADVAGLAAPNGRGRPAAATPRSRLRPIGGGVIGRVGRPDLHLAEDGGADAVGRFGRCGARADRRWRRERAG